MESKAEQSFKELDKARAQGQWSSVPELVKRYKKYHPQESGTVSFLRGVTLKQRTDTFFSCKMYT